MRKYFFTGLATLLPLAVTVLVGHWIINFLTKPFLGIMMHLIRVFPIPENLITIISQLLILISLIVFIFLLGMVGRWFIFHTLLRSGEKLLQRIPLINKIYKTTKDIIKTLFSSEKNSLRQVVMLSFPYEGCYILGLVSRDAPQTCNQSYGKDMVSIFIPTTPNPTTGFLIVRPKEELIFLKMLPEDAIKYIVSCGVVPTETKDPS